MNFKAEMNERVEQIEQILDQYLPPKEGLQKTVLTAMNTTVTDILEEVRTEMGDGYCVYPRITPNDYEKYKRICDEECPLNKL